MWDIQSPAGGTQKTRVTYQTGGITWWADYNLIFNEGADANSGLLDLSAWVSIINQSGATYSECEAQAHRRRRASRAARDGMDRMFAPYVMEAAAAAAAVDGFVQKDFFEFHLYTLGRPTTLPNNSTKQIELFDQAKQIPAKKILLYYGALNPYCTTSPYTDREHRRGDEQEGRRVPGVQERQGSSASACRCPRDACACRSSTRPTAASSSSARTRSITRPRTSRCASSSAPPSTWSASAARWTSRSTARREWMEEEIEVKLRNHKTQPVDVVVKENLYRWSNWKILTKTHNFVKEDARTISFPVKVPKDGETVVRYRVRYTW